MYAWLHRQVWNENSFMDDLVGSAQVAMDHRELRQQLFTCSQTRTPVTSLIMTPTGSLDVQIFLVTCDQVRGPALCSCSRRRWVHARACC